MDAVWEEVERMALTNAADALRLNASSSPDEAQITRWQRFSASTRREGLSKIRPQRSDVTMTRITEEHWELVREEREVMSHDCETYEHSMQLVDVLEA